MSNQRVIIFDSPDGTGKTNMAQALSERTGISYFRMASQHDNWRAGKFKTALEFDQTYISEFLRQTKLSVIIDRAYPSEWVYSRVYNRETNLEVLRLVDDTFASFGTTIVIPLRRDYRGSREDEVVEQSMLPRLHDAYLDFEKWTRCKTCILYVDELNDDIQEELPIIRRVADV